MNTLSLDFHSLSPRITTSIKLLGMVNTNDILAVSAGLCITFLQIMFCAAVKLDHIYFDGAYFSCQHSNDALGLSIHVYLLKSRRDSMFPVGGKNQILNVFYSAASESCLCLCVLALS